MEDWAEIVKTVRKKEKLIQREFAKKIGVSSQLIVGSMGVVNL